MDLGSLNISLQSLPWDVIVTFSVVQLTSFLRGIIDKTTYGKYFDGWIINLVAVVVGGVVGLVIGNLEMGLALGLAATVGHTVVTNSSPVIGAK